MNTTEIPEFELAVLGLLNIVLSRCGPGKLLDRFTASGEVLKSCWLHSVDDARENLV